MSNSKTTQPAYKVQRVKIKNFKNIDDLEMDLQGKSVFLIGDNELNKTSILQAIWLTLSNKGKPKQVIKSGETSANIIVVIGEDGKEYTIEMQFKEGENDKIEITSPDGFKTSKIANLVNLVGSIDFDIIEFVDQTNTAEGRRDQVKTIRGYLSSEENKSIDDLNSDILVIEENRTRINNEIKNLKVEISSKEFSESDVEKYKREIVVTELMSELKKGNEINQNISNAKKELDEEKIAIEKIAKEIESLMKRQIQKEERVRSIAAELENSEPVEIEKINKQIIDSSAHNQKVKDINTHNQKVKDLDVKTNRYKSLDEDRKKLNEQKMKIISNSKLPIDDLTFDENGLYYKGLPLDETQQSTSQLMEIGVKLAMAKNPQCRIVKVARAESIGAKRLKSILELSVKNNFQMFFEEVQRGQDELKIQYVEEPRLDS